MDALLTEEVLPPNYWERWNTENKPRPSTHYNARIEREGLFADWYRSFMRADAFDDTEPGSTQDAA